MSRPSKNLSSQSEARVWVRPISAFYNFLELQEMFSLETKNVDVLTYFIKNKTSIIGPFIFKSSRRHISLDQLEHTYTNGRRNAHGHMGTYA